MFLVGIKRLDNLSTGRFIVPYCFPVYIRVHRQTLRKFEISDIHFIHRWFPEKKQKKQWLI